MAQIRQEMKRVEEMKNNETAGNVYTCNPSTWETGLGRLL